MQPQRIPLVLSVKTLNWRMNDQASEEADSEFQRVRKGALERDNYTCRFCGFRGLKWQEVHHANDDHSDNRLQNLVTACPFCHMCQHIGLAGRNEEAVLIYLPEIDQATLHHLVRSAMVAQRISDLSKSQLEKNPSAHIVKSNREYADQARAVLTAFREREAQAEKRLGTSDPLEIGNAMLMLPDDAYARRADYLAGIRLLPLGRRKQGSEDIMTKMVDSWIETGGAYCNLKTQSWSGVLRSISG